MPDRPGKRHEIEGTGTGTGPEAQFSDNEREHERDLGEGGGCRLLATRGCILSFFSLANFAAFCSLFVFGESSVGLWGRYGGCVVSGIMEVLRGKKVVNLTVC